MAFQMCQGCDKWCLNFTQSEIKCQQKLWPQLSDQVRQTTNRKKSIKCERWPTGVGMLRAVVPIGARCAWHISCQLLPLWVATKRPEARPRVVAGRWHGRRQANSPVALYNDGGGVLGRMDSKLMGPIIPRASTWGQEEAKTPES